MQSARGHCRGGESIASTPTIPVARDTHDISYASKLHVESCIDSLTVRCEFVVHNSMAVKKNHQHDFDFLFAFPWFFRSCRIFLFPLSAVRLQLDVVFVDPRFVACDDPFQEFIAFLWGFPVNATLFPSQLLLRSEQFRYNLGANLFYFQMFRQNRVNGRLSQTKFFCYHSKQSIGGHWARENAHDRCFHYHLRWRGVLTLHRPWGLHGLPENAGPTWKQFFPLGHTLQKPVATFDEFRSHSCPVSQETMLIRCSSCWSTSILTMLENGFHKKLTHKVWPSPRAVGLLLNVSWVLLSEEIWRGAPPVHISLLR